MDSHIMKCLNPEELKEYKSLMNDFGQNYLEENGGCLNGFIYDNFPFGLFE